MRLVHPMGENAVTGVRLGDGIHEGYAGRSASNDLSVCNSACITMDCRLDAYGFHDSKTKLRLHFGPGLLQQSRARVKRNERCADPMMMCSWQSNQTRPMRRPTWMGGSTSMRATTRPAERLSF